MTGEQVPRIHDACGILVALYAIPLKDPMTIERWTGMALRSPRLLSLPG